MIPEMLETFVKVLTPPQLKDNADLDGNTYIDTCQGGVQWGHLEILIITGTIDAALGSTAETTAPLVEECDTTGGSYTAVTDAALADAIAATEDDSIFAIDIDLRSAHKRYMQVQAPHSGDGTNGVNAVIIGILSKPQVAPDTAAKRGLAEQIIV